MEVVLVTVLSGLFSLLLLVGGWAGTRLVRQLDRTTSLVDHLEERFSRHEVAHLASDDREALISAVIEGLSRQAAQR